MSYIQTSHTCQYGVGGDKFSDISNAIRHVQGGAHSCASSITNQTNKAHLTREKALAGYKGASCTEWDKERHRGEMQESSETVRKWGMCSSPFSIIGSRSHRLFCSFAPLLYLALTAVGCCRLSQWDGTGVTKICIKLQSERCDG